MKKVKPTSPGRRGMTFVERKELTKPSTKGLLKPLKKKAGRSSSGRITVRHRGGGAKRKYRIIDFKGGAIGKRFKVLALEYDPNRSARIALVEDENQKKFYFLAPQTLKTGDEIRKEEKGELLIGNRLKLKNVPQGTMVYNIELKPNQGGKLVKSAGVGAQILAQEEKYTQLKLPSGEIRKILGECWASVGQLSNPQHRFEKIGKAGRARHLGRRSFVRGSAMNPVDHPHGGGEGRTGIGLKHPKTKWGKPAYGVKTRKKGKSSNRLIIRRRKKKKRK
jgi:large subunit ribosomal protein L2